MMNACDDRAERLLTAADCPFQSVMDDRPPPPTPDGGLIAFKASLWRRRWRRRQTDDARSWSPSPSRFPPDFTISGIELTERRWLARAADGDTGLLYDAELAACHVARIGAPAGDPAELAGALAGALAAGWQAARDAGWDHYPPGHPYVRPAYIQHDEIDHAMLLRERSRNAFLARQAFRPGASVPPGVAVALDEIGDLDPAGRTPRLTSDGREGVGTLELEGARVVAANGTEWHFEHPDEIDYASLTALNPAAAIYVALRAHGHHPVEVALPALPLSWPPGAPATDRLRALVARDADPELASRILSRMPVDNFAAVAESVSEDETGELYFAIAEYSRELVGRALYGDSWRSALALQDLARKAYLPAPAGPVTARLTATDGAELILGVWRSGQTPADATVGAGPGADRQAGLWTDAPPAAAARMRA